MELFWEVPYRVRVSAELPVILIEDPYSFPQSLYANTGITTWESPQFPPCMLLRTYNPWWCECGNSAVGWHRKQSPRWGCSSARNALMKMNLITEMKPCATKRFIDLIFKNWYFHNIVSYCNKTQTYPFTFKCVYWEWGKFRNEFTLQNIYF
jgi:hypothetical protein